MTVPTNCNRCPHLVTDDLDLESPRCGIRSLDIDDPGERPEWCPLQDEVDNS